MKSSSSYNHNNSNNNDNYHISTSLTSSTSRLYRNNDNLTYKEMNNIIKQHELKRKQNLENVHQHVLDTRAEINRRKQALERKKKVIKMRQDDERKSLLDLGENPDAVFGIRSIRKSRQHKKKKLLNQIRDNERTLLDELLIEEEMIRRKEIKEKRETDMIDAYVESLGRQYRENQIDSYIKSRTKDGRDMVDPTRRKYYNLHPSKFTTVKTHKFGTGRATQDEINLIKEKYPDVIPRSIPKAQENPENYPRPTSSLRRKLEDALYNQRQLISQGKKQKESPDFLLEPNIVEFKDFVVGKEMSCKVKITNVSLSFNQFKILPLSNDICDDFHIIYKPIGRMSAGMETYFTVLFKPYFNRDVKDEICFESLTGPFTLPIIALTKKASVSIKSEQINFGSIPYGSQKIKYIIIKNQGAYKLNFELKSNEVSSLYEFNNSGQINSYSTYKIPIKFSPQRHSHTNRHVYEEFIIKFDTGDQQAPWTSNDEFTIICDANINDIPIYLDNPTLDFKTCYLNRLYRGIIELKNRSTSAIRVKLRVPKPLKKYFNIDPDRCVVQVNEPFPIRVRFTPMENNCEDILKIVNRWIKNNNIEEQLKRCGCLIYWNQDQADINIPIAIQMSGEDLPTYMFLQANITDSQLDFILDTNDFGECYVNETRYMTLTVVNNSKLKQEVCIQATDKNSCLSIYPENGLLTIGTHSQVQTLIGFKPNHALLYEMNLLCRSNNGDEYKFSFIGKGVSSPIEFSKVHINFETIADNYIGQETFIVYNKSNELQTIEFVLPESKVEMNDTYLNIFPQSIDIAANSSKAIHIEFKPNIQKYETINIVNNNEEKVTSKKLNNKKKKQKQKPPKQQNEIKTISKKIDLKNYSNISNIVDSVAGSSIVELKVNNDKSWTRLSRHKLSCFIKNNSKLALTMNISTCVVPPNIELDENDINMGTTTTNNVISKKILLKNNTIVDQKWWTYGFNVNSVFSLVNAPRIIAPNSTHTLLLKFSPKKQRKYTDELIINTTQGQLVLNLKGECNNNNNNDNK